MSPNPNPQNNPDPIDSNINDSTLTEITNNFFLAIHHLPNNTALKKDMERFTTNWKDISNNQEVKDMLLQASHAVKNQDIVQCENIHKNLSQIPAAGWFTLFLHSIIMSLPNKM